MSQIRRFETTYSAVFIEENHSLRQKSFETLKLFIFNLGEYLLALYNLTRIDSNPSKDMVPIIQRDFKPILTFFVVGQNVAV